MNIKRSSFCCGYAWEDVENLINKIGRKNLISIQEDHKYESIIIYYWEDLDEDKCDRGKYDTYFTEQDDDFIRRR